MTTNPEPVHTFGCAFEQRGAECDCGGWVIAGWPDSRPLWSAEVGRAMSRGFDYSQLLGGVAEGIHDDEGGPVSDKPRITINIPPGQPQCPSCGWFNGKHRDDCAEEAVRLRRRKEDQ